MEQLQAVRTSSDTPRRLCERLKVATEKNIESKGVAKGLRTAQSLAAFYGLPRPINRALSRARESVSFSTNLNLSQPYV